MLAIKYAVNFVK